MPWCPKCKYEYREGSTTCSDCGCELVTELVNIEKEKPSNREIDDKEFIDNDVEAFLVTAEGDMEAIIFESKLNSYGIPTLRKYQGWGLHLGINGKKTFIDIYVPSKLLNEAIDIIGKENIE